MDWLGNCPEGLEAPVIDAPTAGSTSIEGMVEVDCVEDIPVTPLDGFEAGVPSETGPAEAVSEVGVLMLVPEDVAVEWEVGIVCDGPATSSVIYSSEESDMRSTVIDILDCLVGKQRSRRYNNNLLALVAIRAI